MNQAHKWRKVHGKTYLYAMRFRVLFLFIPLFFSNCSEESKELPSDPEKETKREKTPIENFELKDFHCTFEGQIDGKYDIRMELSLFGNSLSGQYYYQKHKACIPLKGNLDPEHKSFELFEYHGEDKKAVFQGKINSSYALQGNWSNLPKRKKQLAFQVNKVNDLFLWFRENLPFHPYQVDRLSNLEGTKKVVNLGQDVSLPENYHMYPVKEGYHGYTIDYGDDFMMRTPYFEYEYLGHRDETYYISTSESGGGTGVFTSIRKLQVRGNQLREMKVIAIGDRCNGGIIQAGIENEKLIFSQQTTDAELLAVASEKVQDLDIYLESCAMCCIGDLVYSYDLNTKELKFEYFDSQITDPQDTGENSKDQNLLYSLLYEIGQTNSFRFTQADIDLLFQRLATATQKTH
ncbi:MAG: hypothetical protein EP338_09030 [Bacteroidetes bacterium]|nr:MAG: hypothetical protein EP338_09030 [Bacteroidota bacterium]